MRVLDSRANKHFINDLKPKVTFLLDAEIDSN